MEVTYIIYHNSCSEAVIKFVRPELHMHKPALQDDINLESMLNRLRSAISQQTVVIGNLRNTKYIEENSRNTDSN